MNRARTQFIVAVTGIVFLGLATLIALVGDIFYDKPSELTFALVTALTGTTGAATAYLFRLNGHPGAQ